MPQPKITTSLRIIKDWAEERGGKPTMVDTFDRTDNKLLGIALPGRPSSEPTKVLQWDEWYDIFRKFKLQFNYQDREPDGELSFKYKIVPKKN